MAKSSSQKGQRKQAARFPLTLHPTGQYCKRIRGKLYYFGTDKQEALERYYEQAAYLHTGKPAELDAASDSTSLKMLCNLYLDRQDTRVKVGEIKPRELHDQELLAPSVSRYIGVDRSVRDTGTG